MKRRTEPAWHKRVMGETPETRRKPIPFYALATLSVDLAQAHEGLQHARREYRDFLREATDGGESRLCKVADHPMANVFEPDHNAPVRGECWPRPVLEPEHWCESCRSVRPWILAVQWWQTERRRIYTKLIRTANKLRNGYR